MLSRALSLATVTLLIGCLTAGAAWAAENRAERPLVEADQEDQHATERPVAGAGALDQHPQRQTHERLKHATPSAMHLTGLTYRHFVTVACLTAAAKHLASDPSGHRASPLHRVGTVTASTRSDGVTVVPAACREAEREDDEESRSVSDRSWTAANFVNGWSEGRTRWR